MQPKELHRSPESPPSVLPTTRVKPESSTVFVKKNEDPNESKSTDCCRNHAPSNTALNATKTTDEARGVDNASEGQV